MPSRRDVLRTLGATAGTALGGCAGVRTDGSKTTDAGDPTDAGDATATTDGTGTATATTTPTTDAAGATPPPRTTGTPLSTAAASAGGRVLAQPAESSPAEIELWFENAGDRPLHAFSGATPPLTEVWSVDPAGMLLLPDDRRHLGALDGELSIRRENGCWRVGSGLIVEDIGYRHRLEPGDRLVGRYSVLAQDAADGCLSPATYRFGPSLSVSLPGSEPGAGAEATTRDGGSAGPTLSSRHALSLDAEGSIAAVSGEVVATDGSA